MSTKSELLALLQAQGGLYVSGEEVARRLGISRAAIWKAVKALEKQGMQVESAPGRGYRLCEGDDVMSKDALAAALAGNPVPLRFATELDSTNLAAKRWAVDGAPHGALVVTAKQTAGRGRLGRRFESPEGGAYLSVVLRPQKAPADAALITSAAAVAVCRATERLCGLSLGIKWVNDLYYKGKKCCGILTEAATDMESGQVDYMVVGIGLNYTTPTDAFAAEGKDVATSLYPGMRPARPRAALVAAIYEELMHAGEELPRRAYLDEYRRRSLVLGRTVTVMAERPYEAEAVAIDDEARLVVRRSDGWSTALSYGEISVRL